MKRQWSQEQLKKWLIDKWKTPRGDVRPTTPFGPIEQEILANFERVVTDEFGDYRVYDNRGNSFAYTFKSGKITIVDFNFDPKHEPNM